MKRARFEVGKQKLFLDLVFGVVGKGGVGKLAKELNVSDRTIRDWHREKYTMPVEVVEGLSRKTGVTSPPFETLDKYWYTVQAGKISGRSTYQRYGRIGGDVESWRVKQKSWWETKGKFAKNKSPILERKQIKPVRKSAELAEMIGVILGDGGITKSQVTITLHNKLDAELAEYVNSKMTKLFGVHPSVRRRDNVFQIVISRANLVDYLVSMGLKVGNKVRQQVEVPAWIRDNPKYSTACLRGLFDTDGCIFSETHRLPSGVYSYLRWNFTNHSMPLRDFVFRTLVALGFDARIRNKFRVQIENKEQIGYYFKVVGSNNPKHVRKVVGRVG